ncbi:MAG: hypothetical protein KDG89_06325, partial [Geminicoccaceae bacterium]|nr:hypothetical protein [Geminicoccaceae bacterium]
MDGLLPELGLEGRTSLLQRQRMKGCASAHAKRPVSKPMHDQSVFEKVLPELAWACSMRLG